MKRRNPAIPLCRGAIISALYVALTYLASLVGLASGVIQLRLSEALTILPVMMPEAIPGLFVGCLISNLLVPGAHPLDIIFGSIATLIGAIGAYLLRKLPKKFIFCATIPTILSNAIIIPFVLKFAYGADGSYPYFMLTVGIGEIISAGIFGVFLYYSIRKMKF